MIYRRSGDTWCGNDEFVVSILWLYIITRGVELKSTQIWQYQTDRADESSSYYQGQFRFFYSHYSRLLFLVIWKTEHRFYEPFLRFILTFQRLGTSLKLLKSLLKAQMTFESHQSYKIVCFNFSDEPANISYQGFPNDQVMFNFKNWRN